MRRVNVTAKRSYGRIMMLRFTPWDRERGKSEAIVISEQGVPVDGAARSWAACPFVAPLAYLRSFMPDRLPPSQAEGIRPGAPGLRRGAAVHETPASYACSLRISRQEGDGGIPFLLIAPCLNVKNIWCLPVLPSSEAKVSWSEIGYRFVNGGVCVPVIYDHMTPIAVQEEFTML